MGLGLARPLLWSVGGLAVLMMVGLSARPPVAAATTLPVAGAVVTQPFGCTAVTFEPVDPGCPSRHFHSGIDLAVAQGTPVYAVAGGEASVQVSSGGYGTHVVVDCGGGISMLYGHLAAAALAGVTQVEAGALIGWVGSTGLSTGPHVHFEVRRDGAAVNPIGWQPAYGGAQQLKE